MAIPKEPRQQMINMMYLVLTALLAMNVSAEILNAFYLVREGIQATTRAIENKNQWTYNALAAQAQKDPKVAAEYYNAALEVKKYADELIQFVEDLKKELIERTGGVDENGKLLGAKNLDEPSILMITQKKGYELQKKINETREKMLSLVEKYDRRGGARDELEKRIVLKAEDPKEPDPERGRLDWVTKNFEMVPTVAAVTILDKVINDARTAEAEVINWFLEQIGAAAFKFDVLIARVVPNTKYVIVGQEFIADIFVAATSSSQQPEIYIGVLDTTKLKRDTLTGRFEETTENPLLRIDDTLITERGVGIFRLKPEKPGVYKYQGAIKVRKPNGEVVWFPFEFDFVAAKVGAVVSPTKMNVFYIGVENPVEVSVPGFPAEDIIVSMTNGTIRPKNKKTGQYVVKVRRPGEASIIVKVKLADGSTKVIDRKKFRVKRVPDPIAMVGNLDPSVKSKVRAGEFKAQRGLVAVIKNFDFDLKFQVISFEMVYRPKRGEAVKIQVRGPLFTGRAKQLIQRARPGDNFSFYEIKVRGPDGTRKLPAISYEII
ncbi:MAG: gliding motility protein GldM [Chlorobi bacterium]|nr:gliding motility protein GldM [Chlorobiota bacterium]